MSIQPKQKPICKTGINKAHGFPGCGSETYKKTYGLCDACLYDWMCQTEPGKVEYRKRYNSLKTKKVKEEKQQTKIQKDKLKTLSEYKNDLQKKINLIIRLIDKGYSCIATQSFEGKMNAGHYSSVGSNPTLRYHLENIWLQSEHSNSWKSGDTLRYQTGIKRLYGKEYLEYLDSLQSIQPIKLTIEDIKQIISICLRIVKWLKLQDRMFSIEERLSLRMKFNKEIGIYK